MSAMHTAFRCGALMRFCMLSTFVLQCHAGLGCPLSLRVRAVVFSVAAIGFTK